MKAELLPWTQVRKSLLRRLLFLLIIQALWCIAMQDSPNGAVTNANSKSVFNAKTYTATVPQSPSLGSTAATRSISHTRGAAGLRVGIVGAGISGAATAYFLRRFFDSQGLQENVEAYKGGDGKHGGIVEFEKRGDYSGLTIDVFERSNRVGGRLDHVYTDVNHWSLADRPFKRPQRCRAPGKHNLNALGVYDSCPPTPSEDAEGNNMWNAAEIGATAFTGSNAIVTSLAQKLGFVLTPAFNNNERTALRNESEVMYESSTWPSITMARLLWRYGLAVPRLKELIAIFEERMQGLYRVLGGDSTNVWVGSCFGTVEELLQAGDPALLAATQTALIELIENELGQDPAVDRLIHEVVASLTRAQLNQTPFVNSLAGLSALLPYMGPSDTFTIKGGLSRLVEALFHVSGSVVRLNNRVIAIEALPKEDAFHIHHTESLHQGNESPATAESKSNHPFEYRVTYIDSEGKVRHRCYDYVVVATPLPLSGEVTSPAAAATRGNSTSHSVSPETEVIRDSPFGTLAGTFPLLKTSSNEEKGTYRSLVNHLINSSPGHALGVVEDHRLGDHGRDADGGNLVDLDLNLLKDEQQAHLFERPIRFGPEFPQHQFLRRTNPYQVTFVTMLQGIPNATYFAGHVAYEDDLQGLKENLEKQSVKVAETSEDTNSMVASEDELAEQVVARLTNAETQEEMILALAEVLGIQLPLPELFSNPPEAVKHAAVPKLSNVPAIKDLPGIYFTTEPHSLTPSSVYAAFVRSQVALGASSHEEDPEVEVTPKAAVSHSKQALPNLKKTHQIRLKRAKNMIKQAGLHDELDLPADDITAPNSTAINSAMLLSVHLSSLTVLERKTLAPRDLLRFAISRLKAAEASKQKGKVKSPLRIRETIAFLENWLQANSDSQLSDNVKGLEMWRVRISSRGPLSRELIQRMFPIRSPGALQWAWFSHPRLSSQAQFETLRLRLKPERALRRRGALFESADQAAASFSSAVPTVNSPRKYINSPTLHQLPSEIPSHVYYLAAAEEAAATIEFMCIAARNIAMLVGRDILGGSDGQSKPVDFEAVSPYTRVAEIQRYASLMWDSEVETDLTSTNLESVASLPRLEHEGIEEDLPTRTATAIGDQDHHGVKSKSSDRLRHKMRPNVSPTPTEASPRVVEPVELPRIHENTSRSAAPAAKKTRAQQGSAQLGARTISKKDKGTEPESQISKSQEPNNKLPKQGTNAGAKKEGSKSQPVATPSDEADLLTQVTSALRRGDVVAHDSLQKISSPEIYADVHKAHTYEGPAELTNNNQLSDASRSNEKAEDLLESENDKIPSQQSHAAEEAASSTESYVKVEPVTDLSSETQSDLSASSSPSSSWLSPWWLRLLPTSLLGQHQEAADPITVRHRTEL